MSSVRYDRVRQGRRPELAVSPDSLAADLLQITGLAEVAVVRPTVSDTGDRPRA